MSMTGLSRCSSCAGRRPPAVVALRSRLNTQASFHFAAIFEFDRTDVDVGLGAVPCAWSRRAAACRSNITASLIMLSHFGSGYCRIPPGFPCPAAPGAAHEGAACDPVSRCSRARTESCARSSRPARGRREFHHQGGAGPVVAVASLQSGRPCDRRRCVPSGWVVPTFVQYTISCGPGVVGLH